MAATRSIIAWPINVLLRPERLVSSGTATESRRVWIRLIEATKLVVILSVSLLMYAAPLTLAGYGVSEDAAAPPVFVAAMEPVVADPVSVWQFLSALSVNSAFMLVATLLAFATFHIGVFLSGSSKGILQSLQAVYYSTGVYLAVIFSLVWHLSMSPQVEVADQFLLSLQAEFFYYFIDLFGVGLELPGGRPETIPATGLTSTGLFILAIILVSAVYFFYVLYVGARVGHGANRIEALMAVAFVLISPAVYVVSVILFSIAV